jgi:dTDP-4-dehydrorhamnose 3,5-epimerase
MRFVRLKFKDVILIKPLNFNDKRGYFSEVYRKDKLDYFLKKKINFCQENKSFSNKNVFRGLHYQKPPFAQSKLVTVLSGSIIDIILDIRINSPNFGKTLIIELDGKNNNQLFIPRGFAHGFVTLSDSAEISYKVDNFYSKEHEMSINVKDPRLKLDLDFENIIINKKDFEAPDLNESYTFDYNLNYYD